MKSLKEQWILQLMWNQRREIMAINKRHAEKRSLPNDMSAHCIHRHNLETLAGELAKERGKEFNPLIEAASILHTYCPWYKK